MRDKIEIIKEYISRLLQDDFIGWNNDQIKGYQTALISVREKIKQLSERQTITEVSENSDSKALHIADVSKLAKFSQKIDKQEDCHAEFVEIVNKEFWNLI